MMMTSLFSHDFYGVLIPSISSTFWPLWLGHRSNTQKHTMTFKNRILNVPVQTLFKTENKTIPKLHCHGKMFASQHKSILKLFEEIFRT